jgi:hypothetical protein
VAQGNEGKEALTNVSVANDLRLTPQAKTVLLHLRKQGGHISPAEALIVYGISRLAACVYEIRQAGYNVDSELRRDAQGHKYTNYRLMNG